MWDTTINDIFNTRLELISIAVNVSEFYQSQISDFYSYIKRSVRYESSLILHSPASEHVNRHDSALPPTAIITATYWPVICLMGCKGKVSVSIIHSRTINHIIWSPLHRELACAVHSECRKRPIHYCIIWHLWHRWRFFLKILFSLFLSLTIYLCVEINH